MPLDGFTNRLGYAVPLRQTSDAKQKQVAAAQGHKGPYVPVILYACQEKEYAYEYVYGSISHGAFTYALTKNLRSMAAARDHRVTFRRLVDATAKELEKLGYQQRAAISGPTARLSSVVPFHGRGVAHSRKKPAKKRGGK